VRRTGFVSYQLSVVSGISASSLYFYSVEKKRQKRKFIVFINNMAFKIEGPASAKMGEIEAVKKMFENFPKTSVINPN